MEIMTLKEVCRILQITEKTARNRLSQGLDMPPSFKFGRNRLFLKEKVEQWLKSK